jgi:hypothetical protein
VTLLLYFDAFSSREPVSTSLEKRSKFYRNIQRPGSPGRFRLAMAACRLQSG